MILLPLIYMSYLDIKYMKINNISLVFLFVLTLSNTSISNIIFMFVILILILLLERLISGKVGGGDLKVILILSLVLGYRIFLVLIIASFCGIIFTLISNKKYIPFIPFITLGVSFVKV